MGLKNLIPTGGKDLPARGDEYDPFSLIRREMNRLFDSFSSGFDVEPFEGRIKTFSPNINVTEGDKEVKISAELPGMDDKDIDVSLSKDSLTIKGEKKQEKEDKGKNYYRMERSFGSFRRTVPLPAEADIDKVKAHFKKGVLTVTIPKTAKSIRATKKIQVKTE